MSTPTEPAFSDLDLSPALLRAIEELGYEHPSPIQAQAIPPLLAGRDLVGQAQTGTGKTAAFALPLLDRLDLDTKERAVQAIVLTPTRELALQVAEAVRSYGKHHRQARRLGAAHLRRPADAHPEERALTTRRAGRHRHARAACGTILQREHALAWPACRFFGLDEADEMLKMGFIEDVEWILDHAPAERQIALFSATMPAPIRRVAQKHLKDVADVKIARKTMTVPAIEQYAIKVGNREKPEALERVLEAEEYEAVLIFVGTQRAAAELSERLQGHGHAAECIHGGMNQQQREAVVSRLKAKRTEVVVATDVAARGLDVDHIGLVVNYDLPRDLEVYVHRIGRTGRAGRGGRSIAFWSARQRGMMRALERFTGQPIESMRIPGRAELVDRRRERFQQKIRELIEEDLGAYTNMLRTMRDEEGLDPMDLAAAAARLAWGESPLYAAPDPEPRPYREHDRPERSDRRPPRHHDDRGHRGSSDDMTEIVIPVGSWSRVRPASIVGAIAGETGLPGRVVGRVNILDRVTFVEVPSEHVAKIMKALKGTTIAGRKVYPRLAHA